MEGFKIYFNVWILNAMLHLKFSPSSADKKFYQTLIKIPQQKWSCASNFNLGSYLDAKLSNGVLWEDEFMNFIFIKGFSSRVGRVLLLMARYFWHLSIQLAKHFVNYERLSSDKSLEEKPKIIWVLFKTLKAKILNVSNVFFRRSW